MFLIQSLTDCKWSLCKTEISIFDLSVFWMKSLSTEVMEIMLIVIDATPWLPNNYRWYAAHIITFTCCSLHQLVSDGAVMPGLSGSSLSLPAHLGSMREGTERLHSAITGLAQSAPSQALSRRVSRTRPPPLSLCLPFSVRWCSQQKEKKKKARASASEALTLSVSWLSPRSQWRFIFSADVPSVWQRVASPSSLKGLPWPRAQEAGKRQSVEVTTLWLCWYTIKRPNYQMIAFWIWFPC